MGKGFLLKRTRGVLCYLPGGSDSRGERTGLQGVKKKKKKKQNRAAEGQQILLKVCSLQDKMGLSWQVVCALAVSS